jgi:hypothetical protein
VSTLAGRMADFVPEPVGHVDLPAGGWAALCPVTGPVARRGLGWDPAESTQPPAPCPHTPTR